MKKIKEIKKAPIVYIGVSVLCLITFIIYNQFLHGRYFSASFRMLYLPGYGAHIIRDA